VTGRAQCSFPDLFAVRFSPRIRRCPYSPKPAATHLDAMLGGYRRLYARLWCDWPPPCGVRCGGRPNCPPQTRAGSGGCCLLAPAGSPAAEAHAPAVLDELACVFEPACRRGRGLLFAQAFADPKTSVGRRSRGRLVQISNATPAGPITACDASARWFRRLRSAAASAAADLLVLESNILFRFCLTVR